jgi:hypothetical protein
MPFPSLSLQTNLVQYQKSEFTTDRRYNDFVWLYDKLKESFKGYIIPPMPDKTIIQSTVHLIPRAQLANEVVNRRRAHNIRVWCRPLRPWLH